MFGFVTCRLCLFTSTFKEIGALFFIYLCLRLPSLFLYFYFYTVKIKSMCMLYCCHNIFCSIRKLKINKQNTKSMSGESTCFKQEKNIKGPQPFSTTWLLRRSPVRTSIQDRRDSPDMLVMAILGHASALQVSIFPVLGKPTGDGWDEKIFLMGWMQYKPHWPENDQGSDILQDPLDSTPWHSSFHPTSTTPQHSSWIYLSLGSLSQSFLIRRGELIIHWFISLKI